MASRGLRADPPVPVRKTHGVVRIGKQVDQIVIATDFGMGRPAVKMTLSAKPRRCAWAFGGRPGDRRPPAEHQIWPRGRHPERMHPAAGQALRRRRRTDRPSTVQTSSPSLRLSAAVCSPGGTPQSSRYHRVGNHGDPRFSHPTRRMSLRSPSQMVRALVDPPADHGSQAPGCPIAQATLGCRTVIDCGVPQKARISCTPPECQPPPDE